MQNLCSSDQQFGSIWHLKLVRFAPSVNAFKNRLNKHWHGHLSKFEGTCYQTCNLPEEQPSLLVWWLTSWCRIWWVNSSAHQRHQSLQVEGTKYWVPILLLTVPEVFLIGHVLDWREGVAKKWTQPACMVLTSMIYCICMTIHYHCFGCCFTGHQHKGGYNTPNIVIVNLVETNIVIVNLVETNI